MQKSINLEINSIAWPLTRLSELIDGLVHITRLASNPTELPKFGYTQDEHLDGEKLSKWIDVAAGNLNLESESIEVYYSEIEETLKASSPVIIRIPGSYDIHRPQMVALIKGNRKHVIVLTPQLRKQKMLTTDLAKLINTPFEAPILPALDKLIEDATVQPNRINQVRKAILKERLSSLRIQIGWILRPSPGENIWKQFRQIGALKPLILMFVYYVFQQVLAILSWYILGRGVFMGHYDSGWIFAWFILLIAAIPLSIFIGDVQNELTLRTGTIFKSRLLQGILKLKPEEIRHQGMGQFLGRVMESESVEMLALNGGLLAFLSIIELIFAAFILGNGAGGLVHVIILAIWVIVVAALLIRYIRAAINWTTSYQKITNELVENMVGHRTRLAQERPENWHDREDQILSTYLRDSEGLDVSGVWLSSTTSRGWLLIGTFWLALIYISSQVSPQSLAISLGGIIYATQALNKLVSGFQSLSSLFIAWKQVGPLFQSASRPRDVQSLMFYDYRVSEAGSKPVESYGEASYPRTDLINSRDLSFRYHPHGRLVLEKCDLKIKSGERLLLMGPSGGGKSTLVSILAGLRKPETGSLLLNGVDREIIGTEEWRRQVVMAPQFQENHIFSDTLAFNLLMGRHWPPLPEDLEEAEAVCKDLGLLDVINKMPSGFQQILGESGWQLSHGERSRLYIARTLLQSAEMVILDESFGALDAENLQRAIETVERRAKTLLVIAHP